MDAQERQPPEHHQLVLNRFVAAGLADPTNCATRLLKS